LTAGQSGGRYRAAQANNVPAIRAHLQDFITSSRRPFRSGIIGLNVQPI
jgi:TPP-dependent trihydroxycyclohexane-1,2-dione (THcHDO) dehydratase